MKLPKIIFLVGSAGSGKSTLAKIIKNNFPIYHLVTDLSELKRIAKSEMLHKNQSRIKPLPSGGFNIENPRIWDEILFFTAKKLSPEKFYIFEFARGVDLKYLIAFKISKYKVYERVFRLIFGVKPEIKVKDAFIIHVYCDFNTRLSRNRLRKKEGHHFVAEEVMRNVYSEDIFQYTHIGFNYGYFSDGDKIKILVYSIDNSKKLPLTDRRKYLKLQIYQALDFYNAGALSQINKRR